MAVTQADDSTSAERPTDAFSAVSTERTLVAACASTGLDASGARLVRLGENAVFQLGAHSAIVRIARSTAYLPEIRRGVDVARWLRDIDFPAVRLIDGIDQPLVIDGRVVTFWEELSSDYATVADLAVMLRRLHTLEPPDSLSLPALKPLDRTKQRVEASQLSADDRTFLLSRVEDLSARWHSMSFALPGGLIHGDASIGNVILAHDGQPVLIDLDGFSVGPREWDLVLTALYHERLGWHTRPEYLRFASLYGFDVLTWPGYHTLRGMRELIMVGWLAQNLDEGQDVPAEVAKRLNDLRSQRDGRLDWKPF